MTKPIRIDAFRDPDEKFTGLLVDGRNFDGTVSIDIRVGACPVVKLNGSVVENCDVFMWSNPTPYAIVRPQPKRTRRARAT